MFIVRSGLGSVKCINQVEISSQPPTSPVEGQLWLDTSSEPPILKVFNGSVWVVVGSSEVGGYEVISNADMVDGFHASQTPAPNTIPVSNEDGKLDPEWLPDLEVNISDVIYVTADGKVGIGTTEPLSKLSVKTSEVSLSPVRVDALFEMPMSTTGWLYKKPITISNAAGDLTDYQVLVVLDTQSLISQGKMRSDCGDIRFFDSDGTTLLDYWIEDGINTPNTRIWVKVPFIQANSTKTIYVYYGNSNATSLSSVANVFIREISGLVGAWDFDEGSGTVAYDKSGYNRNAVLYGGATWASGRFGRAVSCDGVDDYIEIGGNISPTSQITLAIWAYVTGDNGASNQDLIRKSLSNGQGYHIRWRHGDNYVRFYLNINGVWYNIKDPTVNTSYLNGWHHFVGTYDGSKMNFYVDNVLKGSLNVSGHITYDSSTVTWLMKEGAGYLRGYVDNFFIFNRALTAEEVSDLYNNYGYATASYPGKVLVRKYVSPEPSVSIGDEVINSDISFERYYQTVFYIQEGTGNVGIWTTEPTARLHVSGAVKVDGSFNAKVHVVSNNTLLGNNHCIVLANASSRPITITLPFCV
jgi:hypothetical protein